MGWRFLGACLPAQDAQMTLRRHPANPPPPTAAHLHSIMPGDEFQVYSSDSDARAAASAAEMGLRQARLADMTASGSMVTLSSLATYDEEGGQDVQQRMNLIIKGDTSGVVEAIRGALTALPQDVVVLRYLLCAAGDISTSDIDLAAASGGMVVGFNIEPDEGVLTHAKRLGECVWVVVGCQGFFFGGREVERERGRVRKGGRGKRACGRSIGVERLKKLRQIFESCRRAHFFSFWLVVGTDNTP